MPDLTIPASASTRLAGMVAANDEPELDADQITSLLTTFAVPDDDGRAPGADDWVPTFDFGSAAAEGWRWKAGKVAGQFDFESDQQRFWRSQMYKHCLEQAAHYAGEVSRPLLRPR